ncbi:hypothetical protein BGZ60DRAFT_434770 [Tricladium varicosporioides]|nr:hypothetical protein BGZ60DRAFT_434770 [Hymenoscyphus varicosporioides]
MEGKKAKAGASKDTVDLSQLDKNIAQLKESQLPHIPHLLHVNINEPLPREFPHENQNTPFEWWEVKALQYMTLVADGDRGIALAKGDWEDEYSGPPATSADARSSTTTPNPFNKDTKKPSVKYSIKDYKNMKQTGVKPSPRSVAEAERKPGHTRNTSAMSLDTPMSRVSSMEGPTPTSEKRTNGVAASNNSVNVERFPRKEDRLNITSNRSNAKGSPLPRTNGNVDRPRDPAQNKDPNTKLNKSDSQRLTPLPKHGLPPRPPSPRREKPEITKNSLKRHLDTSSNPAEKRTKIEPTRTSQQALPKKPEARETKPSPTKSQNSQKSQTHTSQSSPLPKKILTSKSTDKRKTSEKPLDLPPLLSPLPADLDNGPTSQPSGFPTIKKSEAGRNSSSNTPSKKNTSTDTIVVKTKPPLESSPRLTPPTSSMTSPFVLPPLLSPGLPDIVEQELLRLQQKSAVLNTNTVEARHEKARQPDAPGVARKMPKSKVGHPPKKPKDESSRTHDNDKLAPENSKPSLIVKIPYRKQKRMIERILAMKARPSKQFLRLEAEKTTSQAPQTAQKRPAPPPIDHSDSEEDTPLAALPKPPPPPARKRPTDMSESRAPEPAPKRVKVAENGESSKMATPAKPALKSPAHISPSEKTLLATPRKGDAMKTVAMRRVDSNDGNARTPQTAPISTPASAEKPRVNGEVRVHPDIERLKAEEKRLTTQATKLKHKMDEVLKLKTDPRNVEKIPDIQRKLGLCYGLECIVVYMNAFSTKDRISQLSKSMPMFQSWDQLLKLWGFMDGQVHTFPALHALSLRLGALCREELGRLLPETKEFLNKDQKTLDLLKGNTKERDKLWGRCNASRGVVGELGVNDILGPWTSVSGATEFAMEYLGAFARKEKVGWKRDG